LIEAGDSAVLCPDVQPVLVPAVLAIALFAVVVHQVRAAAGGTAAGIAEGAARSLAAPIAWSAALVAFDDYRVDNALAVYVDLGLP
jgi:hypothetical protein